MMRYPNILKFFVFVCWVACVPFAAAAFEATAVVDKNEMTPDDTVFLSIEMSGSGGDADLSGIKDFRVMTRGSSSFTQIINGRTEQKLIRQFMLVPLKKGELTIPAIPVTHDGQTVFTEPIKIMVAESKADDDQAKALFAKAKVMPSILVPGQQAVYSLLFYTSRHVSRVRFESPPDFKGMTIKPFEKEKSYSRRINGVLYQVTQVDYLVIPSVEGRVTIDPAVLIANVIIKKSRTSQFDSFFNDSFFSSRQTKPVRITANPVTIDVTPLPNFLGTPPFSGLIGQFEITAEVDKNSLKAGESITLSIKISGSGNIMDAGAPELKLPEDAFKVYDDNPGEAIRMTENGYSGYKEFKWAIVPMKPGRYTLPQVQLTYYDVEKRNYRIIQSSPIDLEVAPSGKIEVAVVPENASELPEKRAVSLENRDILEIKDGLHVLENYQQISPVVFFVCLLVPACLFGGVSAVVRARQKQISPQKAMTQKAKKHLKRAKQLNPDDDAFWGHLYSALVAMIFSKAGKIGESVTVAEARTVLEQAGVHREQLEDSVWLLETIESVRFGGLEKTSAPVKKVLEKMRRMIKIFCIFIAVGTVIALIPAKVPASPSEIYLQAIKSYRQGDFSQAAGAFEKLAETPIKNPHLYYNIGNAYLKADSIGKAILWYERARKIAPNDPDLRFNLEFANSLVKDKKDEAVNILDIIIFWDDLVRIKTLQFACTFFSVIFFTWAGVRVIRQRHIFTGTGFAILAIFLLVTGVTTASMIKQSSRSHAVIISEEAQIRSGLAKDATRLFTLHAGTKVQVREKRDQYLKIMFSKDKVGWVKIGQAEII